MKTTGGPCFTTTIPDTVRFSRKITLAGRPIGWAPSTWKQPLPEQQSVAGGRERWSRAVVRARRQDQDPQGQQAEGLRARTGRGVSGARGSHRVEKARLRRGKEDTPSSPGAGPAAHLTTGRPARRAAETPGARMGLQQPVFRRRRSQRCSHPLAPVYEAKGKCLISRLIAWVIGRRTQLSK